MDRSHIATFWRRATSKLRSFIARVALIAAVLAVPIIGTSYVLVAQVGGDISMADGERETLVNFAHVSDIFGQLERLHDCIGHIDCAELETARAGVDRAIAAAQGSYDRRDSPSPSNPIWLRLHDRFHRTERDSTVSNVDAVLDTLTDAGNELESNTPLDLDPSSSVQYIADVIMRREPRSIVALQQSADAVAQGGGARLDFRTAERIATRHAREVQAITDWRSDLTYATALEPTLRPRFTAAVRHAQMLTSAYEHRVDVLLAASNPTARDTKAVAMSARGAIDAHLRLWRVAEDEADRLVLHRLGHQLVRRRIVIALASLAVLAGALVVTLVSRYEARRDRIELVAAKLEGEKLRVELSQMSIGRALRLQEAQFRTIFDNADLGITIFDRHGRTLQSNPAVKTMLGAATQEVLDQQADAVVRFERCNHEPFAHEVSRVTDDGRPQYLSFMFSGVYDEGVCQMVILLIRDATEEQLLARQLAYDANHDSMTGLANRAAFERALSAEFADARRDARFALVYLDLDNFKPINDTFGHGAGDHVLVTSAERLRSAVGSGDLCARLGGDEFAILLRSVAQPATIDAIARRLLAAIAAPITYDGDFELSVTASIGIAICDSGFRSSAEIKRGADRALYAVKKAGRNAHFIFEHGRDHAVTR